MAENVSRVGEFRNSTPIIFMTQAGAVLCAANEEVSSNACRKLMRRRTIKNPQHGIRAQMVLKLTNKLQKAEIETNSRIDVFKQTFHHHLDNFISFP